MGVAVTPFWGLRRAPEVGIKDEKCHYYTTIKADQPGIVIKRIKSTVFFL